MKSGFVDLAFVSDSAYAEGVETTPAFKEPMLFVCGGNAGYPEIVHPSALNPLKQIKISWSPEYEAWHKYWFKPEFPPRVFLDKMSILEEFLFGEDNWAIVPASIADSLCEKVPDVVVRRMARRTGSSIT